MTDNSGNIGQLTDHLFRREAGKMVAFLTRMLGADQIEAAEDIVQDTLLKAYNSWPAKGIPDNPSAWLFRVARNKAIDHIRHGKHTISSDFEDDAPVLSAMSALSEAGADVRKRELVEDDMLRMMFACCQPGIAMDGQITLILKTLCGFSTAEIARAFQIPEDTVSKRLYRTREFFRNNNVRLVIPSVAELKNRIDAVLNAVYLLFNEGYNSTHAEELIRKDLMAEAMLLCKLITEHPAATCPEANALMALMCFHCSRVDSRLTTEGEIILLPNQDRSKWDHQLIDLGNIYMSRSASGPSISPYHLEAAIAFEHCTAPSYAETNWRQILTWYNWLCNLSSSPFTELNRAVALMQTDGAAEALIALENISEPKKINGFYLYHAVLGEVYLRLSRREEARESFEHAIKLTQSSAEKKVLREKMRG